MRSNTRFLAGMLALALARTLFIGDLVSAERASAAEPAAEACKLVKTAKDLQAMRLDLAGTYCLANDIDLSSLANFYPIGYTHVPFTGKLLGRNHVISNLKIDSDKDLVGMFGLLGNGAVIRDVRLVNVDVFCTYAASAGGLVASAYQAATISNVSVTGKVNCTYASGSSRAGGIVGEFTGILANSWSSADVSATAFAGGLIGNLFQTTVSDSFATGNVVCRADNCMAGGLAANGSGGSAVLRSFATGSVSSAGAGSMLGGMIGYVSNNSDGTLNFTFGRCFATGPVSGGASSIVGGLVGQLSDPTSRVDQCYAVGPVQGGVGASVGGLIGQATGAPSVTKSYWDVNTSGTTTSAGGTAKTTAQLRFALPPSFSTAAWSITRTLSYPFLNDAKLDFVSPLATLVVSNRVFDFLPISQLDISQYLNPPAHSDEAALATAYTMIARAIGITDDVATLKSVSIDRYFWDDATQTATFAGPVTEHATLGPLMSLGNAQMANSNVIGQINLKKLVILRGVYTKSGGGAGVHWMLATMDTRNPDNTISAVVANDPWIGVQVTIDPVTKTVVSPANFPLMGFRVDGYRAVTVN